MMIVSPRDVVSVAPNGAWVPLTYSQMEKFCTAERANRLIHLLPTEVTSVSLDDGSIEGAPFHGQIEDVNLYFLTADGPRPWRIHGAAVIHSLGGDVATALVDEFCADLLGGEARDLRLVIDEVVESIARFRWVSK
jgi:hypothetical protein